MARDLVAEPSTNLPVIFAEDFGSPSVVADKLNSLHKIIAEQVAAVQGAAGPILLKNYVTAHRYLQYGNELKIPTDDHQLITYGQAKQLFGGTTTTIVGSGGSGPTTPNYFRTIEEYGGGEAKSPADNTKALTDFINDPTLKVRVLHLTAPYYQIKKTNLYGGSSSTGGFRIVSTASNATSLGLGMTDGYGTVLECDGTGASWLTACLNIVAPNAGDTAPDYTKLVTGVHLRGIYVDVKAAVTGLNGFWFGNCIEGMIEYCGVVDNAAAAWVNGILMDRCTTMYFKRPRVSRCITGISTNLPSGFGATAASTSIWIEMPSVIRCTNAIGTPFSTDVAIMGGDIDLNTNGVVTNSPNTTISGTRFTANSGKHVTCVTAVAPFGGTYRPDYQYIVGCNFDNSAPAWELKDSTGTIFEANYVGLSWSIDSACRLTRIEPQLKLYTTTFTDSAPDTIFNEVVLLAFNPIGLANGIRGQRAFDTVGSGWYVCTVSHATPGSATWVQTVSATTPPPAWTAFTPTVTTDVGTISVATSECAYQASGKNCLVRVHLFATITGGLPSFIYVQLPVTVKSGGTTYKQALGGPLAYNGNATGAPLINVINGSTSQIEICFGNFGGTQFVPGDQMECWLGGPIELN